MDWPCSPKEFILTCQTRRDMSETTMALIMTWMSLSNLSVPTLAFFIVTNIKKVPGRFGRGIPDFRVTYILIYAMSYTGVAWIIGCWNGGLWILSIVELGWTLSSTFENNVQCCQIKTTIHPISNMYTQTIWLKHPKLVVVASVALDAKGLFYPPTTLSSCELGWFDVIYEQNSSQWEYFLCVSFLNLVT